MGRDRVERGAADSAVGGETWWQAWRPVPPTVTIGEQLRAALGAGVGIVLTGYLCLRWGAAAGPWLIAPLGASAVLVFAVPASPLAQPWAVIGGNTLSALIAIALVNLYGASPWTAGLAVALAIATMFRLRCLHPPGGASALLVALGGVHAFQFALFPVLINSLSLVLIGVLFNSLTGRSYPHQALSVAVTPPLDLDTLRDELNQAVHRHNMVLDISLEDLRSLFEETVQRHADAAGAQTSASLADQ